MNQDVSPQSFPVVTAQMLKEYAAASGDSNPIHLDETVARAAGLPGIIAHGMLVAAWLAERALGFADESGKPLVLCEFSARFRAMVFLGDTVSVGGVVKESGSDGMLLELQARNQKGEVTTTGIARFRQQPLQLSS